MHGIGTVGHLLQIAHERKRPIRLSPTLGLQRRAINAMGHNAAICLAAPVTEISAEAAPLPFNCGFLEQPVLQHSFTLTCVIHQEQRIALLRAEKTLHQCTRRQGAVGSFQVNSDPPRCPRHHQRIRAVTQADRTPAISQFGWLTRRRNQRESGWGHLKQRSEQGTHPET